MIRRVPVQQQSCIPVFIDKQYNNRALLSIYPMSTPLLKRTSSYHSSAQTLNFPLYLVIYNNDKLKISPTRMREIFTKQAYKYSSVRFHLRKWNYRVEFNFQSKEARNESIQEIKKIKERYDVNCYYYFQRGLSTYSLMEEWEYRNAIAFSSNHIVETFTFKSETVKPIAQEKTNVKPVVESQLKPKKNQKQLEKIIEAENEKQREKEEEERKAKQIERQIQIELQRKRQRDEEERQRIEAMNRLMEEENARLAMKNLEEQAKQQERIATLKAKQIQNKPALKPEFQTPRDPRKRKQVQQDLYQPFINFSNISSIIQPKSQQSMPMDPNDSRMEIEQPEDENEIEKILSNMEMVEKLLRLQFSLIDYLG